MKKQLKDFMKICISYNYVPLSWGINNIYIDDNTIKFNVVGCKLQTQVTIAERDNKLLIKLNNYEKNFTNGYDALQWLNNQID